MMTGQDLLRLIYSAKALYLPMLLDNQKNIAYLKKIPRLRPHIILVVIILKLR